MNEPVAQPSRLTSLDILRSEGAQRLDPARFHYLEVLAMRLQTQPVAVRRILEGKLDAALLAYTERLRQMPRPAPRAGVTRRPGQRPDVAQERTPSTKAGASSPALASLIQLNQYLQTKSQEAVDPGLNGEGEHSTEMKSVRHFKQALSKSRAQEQVEQALGQGPEKAGPLNSHLLVLGSLTWMRQLSPAYLQRFLSYADSLLWLDKVGVKSAPVEVKTIRRSRVKK